MSVYSSKYKRRHFAFKSITSYHKRMTSYLYFLGLVISVDVPQANLAALRASGDALPLLRAADARDLVGGGPLAPENKRYVHLNERHSCREKVPG